MIQEIKVKNFRSFRDEVTFSFEASEDTFAEDYQVVKIDEKTRLLRFAIIYGYNASGKSNLLYVFDFLSHFWNYKPDDIEEGTSATPFKLDDFSRNEPSCFQLVFFVNTTKYLYQLELDTKEVHLEKLSYYDSDEPIMLFERFIDNGLSVINFGNDNNISDSVRELITIQCLKNMSFFVARDKVNISLPLIDEAKDWMKTQIMSTIFPLTRLTSYAERKVAENKELLQYIVDFLNEADFNITKISSTKTNQKISKEFVNLLLMDDEISDSEKEHLKNDGTFETLRTIFEHTVENDTEKKAYTMGSEDQSTGTLRTFGLETALYELINNGKSVLPVDEIETSIHPKLVEKILFEYLKNHSRTQLIVTTHNDGLLDLVDDLIRKDSIWFTDKDVKGVTDLYKLTDFRGIERLNSIREAYRNKRFGATMK
ncbi:MAG: ATP-binding protein [Bacteroidales bacterium]|nr:ATP-binding protein [Bacteroidales bacterium]